MKSINYLLALITAVIVVIMILPSVLADVKLSIRNDQYVFPPSEFAGTEAYPDIITIENDNVILEILPNRGITIWRLHSKLTGNENLYFNPSPLPYKDEISGAYYIEFGGYYPLYPWNKRDNQPLMTKYEITEESPNKITVYLHGEEIETGAKIEQWVTLEEKTSIIKIKTKISNISGKTLSFKFGKRLVASVGGQLTEGTYFELPVNEIKIIKSNNNWMGQPGEVKSWPQPWSLWKNFEDVGIYSAELKKSFFTIINKDTGDSLIKTWMPIDFYKNIVVRGWGHKFSEAGFNIPIAYLQSETEELSLPPNGAVDFEDFIFVADGLDLVDSANQYAAGYLRTDKYNYSSSEEIFVRLGIATSSLESNVKIQLNLLTLDGTKVKELLSEDLGDLYAGKSGQKEFRIKTPDINAGKYQIQAVIASGRHELLELKREIELTTAPINILYYIIPAIIAALILTSTLVLLYRRRKKSIKL
jgi:hypothetical protein